MGKERSTVGKRGFTQPVVCRSAVKHYTGAYEVEEMGVWEQRQPSGNIPPLPSLSQVKTVWKCSLIRGRRGGISKYQPIFSMCGILTVREPKQISSGPLAHVDPVLNSPFLSTWFLQSSALTQPARQSDTSSGNSTPPPPPGSSSPKPFLCLSARLSVCPVLTPGPGPCTLMRSIVLL